MTDIRIGHGYDVHRFEIGRRLILGGVYIPNNTGLLGHSDADVLCHAIADALLGACALGDIGRYFPDNDPQYKDISSIKLLCRVAGIIGDMKISNIDATVIAQSPKLAPYIDEMRKNIADALSTDISRISIKATTEEGLGFTGERLGIAAHAVALLYK